MLNSILMSSITTCHLYTYIFVSNLTCKWVVLSIKICHLYNNIKCHWITHENWQHGEYKSEINHEQETKKKKKKKRIFSTQQARVGLKKTQRPFTCAPLGHTFFSFGIWKKKNLVKVHVLSLHFHPIPILVRTF